MRTVRTHDRPGPPSGRATAPAGPAAADAVFFEQWRARRPGETRSLDRARELLTRLGPEAATGLPVLTVVGSKGKGTAATYASACLAAAGLRVVTVTSPGLRSNRERVRLDGTAVSEPELRALATRLRTAIADLPRDGTGIGGRRGYLSPAGLFTLAGLMHARSVAADVIVLEAGMGGAHDEAALVPAAAVAITPVFAEHVGVLGDTPADIAREKAGVTSPATSAVLTVPQQAEVAAAIAGTVRERTAGAVEVEVVDGRLQAPPGPAVPDRVLPGGLHRANALLGTAAAGRLLQIQGWPAPAPGRLSAVLSSVRLPGRSSWHNVPGGDDGGADDRGGDGGGEVLLLADCAIDGTGVSAALREMRERHGGTDHVLLCLPDHKDLPGAAAALTGVPVTFVRLPDRHLRFDREPPSHWQVMDVTDLGLRELLDRGPRLAALGTVYFVGRVLDLIGADTERLFRP